MKITNTRKQVEDLLRFALGDNCRACNGKGAVKKVPCGTCNAKGTIPLDATKDLDEAIREGKRAANVRAKKEGRPPAFVKPPVATLAPAHTATITEEQRAQYLQDFAWGSHQLAERMERDRRLIAKGWIKPKVAKRERKPKKVWKITLPAKPKLIIIKKAPKKVFTIRRTK